MLGGPAKPSLKIIVAGDGGVGKTALVIAFVQHVFAAEYDPTIEDTYRKTMKAENGDEYVVDMLDTAGPEEFTALRDQWFRECHLCLCCFDICRRSSFEDAARHIEKFRRVKDGNPFASVVLCANKIDQRPTSRAEISSDEAKAFCKSMKLDAYVETSAMTFEGVDAAFETCLRVFLSKPREGSAEGEKKKCVVC